MENYVEMELAETFSEQFRPIFVRVDGKAHINGANDGSSPYVGLAKGPATAGQTVRVYPGGVVKNLSGIAAKTNYQYRNVLEEFVGENFRMDEWNSNPQCAYVGGGKFVGIGYTTEQTKCGIFDLTTGIKTDLPDISAIAGHKLIVAGGKLWSV